MTAQRSRPALALLCALLSATAMAQDPDYTFWTAGSGGSFDNRLNWSHGVPDPFIRAFFATVGGLITFDTIESPASKTLEFWNTDVWFDATFKFDYVTPLVEVGIRPGQNASLTMLSGELEAISVSVGEHGTGVLTLFGDAYVVCSEANIGDGLSGEGSIIIDGFDAGILVTSFLEVGGAGTGQLTLLSSGKISACLGTTGIGLDIETGVGSGVMTVNGAGSEWFNLGWMHVGWFSQGTLNITAGGLVNAETGVIGNLAGAIGEANVDGIGSSWDILSQLLVGRMGSASLCITNGGSVSSSTGVIGGFAGSSGAVDVDGAGSTWTNLFDLSVGVFGTATLTVTDGGTVVAPSINVNETGEIHGDGFLDADVMNQGVVSPGSSARVLTVLGDYQQTPSGRLDISIGQFDNDELNVHGQATLAGVLNLSFDEGDEPELLEVFTVLTANSIVGAFESINCKGTQFQILPDVDAIRVQVIGLEPVDCDVVHWTARTGGPFDVPENWDSVVPGVFSTAVFDSVNSPPPAYVVDFFTNAATDRLIVLSEAAVQFELGGRDYFVAGGFDPTEPSIVVGELAGVSSRLTVRNIVGGFHGLHGSATSIGHGPGSSGELTVTGAFTLFDSEDLDIGFAGAGAFSVEDGALATTVGDVSFAQVVGLLGEVSVTNPGSKWLTTGSRFFVGEFGNGTLTISDGGQLLSNTVVDGPNDGVILAVNPGSTALVTVTGQGSKWIEGTAPMFIAGQGDATVVVKDGGVIQFPDLPGAGVIIDSTGHLVGNGTVVANVINVGEVRPEGMGQSSGVLTIDGNYEQVDVPGGGQVEESGSLVIDITGLVAGSDYDQLIVTGEVRLGGGVFVTFPDTFDPQADDTFTFLQAGSVHPGFPAFDVGFITGLAPNKVVVVDYGAGAASGPTGLNLIVFNLEDLIGFGNPDNVEVNGVIADAVVDDFNGDGIPDLALVVGGDPGSVVILEGDGESFMQTQLIVVGNSPRGITSAPLDGVAGIDLAVTNAADGTVSVLLNNGSGVFGSDPTPIPVGNNPVAIAAADFREDLDGDIDLFVANAGDNELAVLVNDGAANFVSLISIPTGLMPFAVDPSDLDNDKDIDALVVANVDSDTLTVVMILGGGAFTTTTLDVGDAPVALTHADYNNDFATDIVTANRGDDTNGAATVSVLINNGDNTFAPAVTLPVGTLATSIVSIDMDGDGDADLAVVVTDEQNERVVRVLRNDFIHDDIQEQQLTFTLDQDLDQGENPVLVRKADVNLDGADDLITINDAGALNAASGAGPVPSSISVLLSTCPWDCGGATDGFVGIVDFLALLAQWGGAGTCNFDGGVIGITDFLELLANWGPCP